MDNKEIILEDLIDIRDVCIDIEKSLIEWSKSYLEQIKNPYRFKYKDIIIDVKYVGDESLENKIIQYLNKKMSE